MLLVWTKSRTGAKNLDHLLREYGDNTLTKDCHIVENAEITLQNRAEKKKSCKQKKTCIECVFAYHFQYKYTRNLRKIWIPLQDA